MKLTIKINMNKVENDNKNQGEFAYFICFQIKIQNYPNLLNSLPLSKSIVINCYMVGDFNKLGS